jgi:hypothetical protein
LPEEKIPLVQRISLALQLLPDYPITPDQQAGKQSEDCGSDDRGSEKGKRNCSVQEKDEQCGREE